MDKVREARNEEIKFMQMKGIWEVVPTRECWERTGSAPVSVRWVDTNKGGPGEMMVRSRLVARDLKGNDKGGVIYLRKRLHWRRCGCCSGEQRLEE